MIKDYSAYVVCYVILFSLVISPDFSISGLNIPNFLPFLALPILLRQFDKSELALISNCMIGFFLIILCSIFLVEGPFFYLSERITGGFQIVAGILLLLVLLANLPRILIDRNFLRIIDNFILCTFFTVIFIAILERTGLAVSVLASLREAIYSVSLYDGVDRDFGAYGFTRPLAVMKEPAHLAWFLAVFGFYLYKAKKVSLPGSVIIGMLCLYLTYSPVYACFFFALAIDRFYHVQKKALVVFLGIILVAILIFILAPILLYRYDAFLYGSDISTISRLVAPPVVAWEVFLDNPLFGIGPTAHSLAFNYVYDVFENYGDYRVYSALSDDVISKRITNYFFESLIYLGAVGAITFYWLVYKFLNATMGRKDSLWFINLIVFSLGMGGFVTVKFFAATFLLILISYRCKIEN